MSLVSCFAAQALAGPQETATFTAVPSSGEYASPLNAVRTLQASGSYSVGQVRIEGALSKVNQYTFSLEATVEVTAPSGEVLVFHACPGGAFQTSVTGSRTHSLCELPAAAGTWTCRFYEEFDDSGAIDAMWDSVTITLFDDAARPSGVESLGQAGATQTVRDAALDAAQVRWYELVVPADVTVASGRGLWIDTLGSAIPDNDGLSYPNDTFLSLFDAGGTLVAYNEDYDFDAEDFTAVLSFGASQNARHNGADGDLPAGTYLLAVSTTSFNGNCFYAEPYTLQPGQLHLTLAGAGLSCAADFNGDATVDLFDYLDFLQEFSHQTAAADFNHDSVVDLFDYLDFLQAFSSGC